jgi:hypothetical protein
LRRDPALVVYYTFDNPLDRPDVVANRAGATAGRLDGLLGDGVEPSRSPEWSAAGRWPEQRALQFQAARRQVVRVAHSNELNITQAVTLAAWIRPSVALLEPTAVICAKLAPRGALSANYELSLIEQHAAAGDALCSLAFRAGRRQLVSPAIAAVPGKWIHVAATASAARTILYVDGRPVAQGEGAELVPNEGDLLIGSAAGERRAAGVVGTRSFDGLLGELVLVRRVMSKEEISQMVSSSPQQR